MSWVVPVARRWPDDWSAWVIDVAIALFSTAAAVTLHSETVAARSQRELLSPSLAVAITYGSVVLFRRKSPQGVLAVMLVCGWLYVLGGFPVYMLGPGLVFVMYSAGAGLPRKASAIALAVAEVNMLVLLLVGPSFPGPGSMVLFGAILASSWALGDLLRRWRTAAADHARRADELAATREELARYAVIEERRRIARELHDVVAHAMTVVAMHAGTGRLAATTDPAAATSSLHTIEKVSREALSEMRRLVTLLRDDSDDESLLSPTPSLGDLHRLVGEMVGAGMVIDVRTEGPIDRLSPGLSAVAFRTIQEALTNAAQHAGPVRARLEVIAMEEELVVTVENDPPTAEVVSKTGDGGTGLLGMRERVQLYGGSLVTEGQPNGGFRVEVRFPLESSR